MVELIPIAKRIGIVRGHYQIFTNRSKANWNLMVELIPMNIGIIKPPSPLWGGAEKLMG
jgi:hypothetical protein